MDWIRKNRFLAGFLGVVIVGVGVLGYLLFSQMTVYDQTSQEYESSVRDLQRLQSTTPYPYQPSKVKLVELRKETEDRVRDLQKRLADYEPAPEKADFKPIDFQDKLRRVVDDVSQAAHAVNMTLPADFYMGFEQYRGTPPDANAAPALSRELDAIEDLLKILINRRVDTLTAIKRAPLPQEPGGNATAATAVGRPNTGGKPAPAAPADSVSRNPVEIVFTCQPSSFRETLDDIVTAKRLYLVRALEVKNQSQKGPTREQPGIPAAPPVPSAPAPGPGSSTDPGAAAAADKPSIQYIVGLEKLDVDMRIEIVKVAPPAR